MLARYSPDIGNQTVCLVLVETELRHARVAYDDPVDQVWSRIVVLIALGDERKAGRARVWAQAGPPGRMAPCAVLARDVTTDPDALEIVGALRIGRHGCDRPRQQEGEQCDALRDLSTHGRSLFHLDQAVIDLAQSKLVVVSREWSPWSGRNRPAETARPSHFGTAV